MKHENFLILHYLLSQQETNAILGDIRELSEDKKLFEILWKHNIILEIRSTYQNADSAILVFVQERIAKLDIPLEIDDKKLYKSVYKQLQKKRITEQEVPLYVIKKLKKKLPKNYTICLIDRNDDALYIAVLKKKHFKKLAKQKSTIGVFTKLQDEPQDEVSYIIECECGTTNVWQQPKTDGPPLQEQCISCRKDLFYPSGSPIFAMNIELL